MNQSNTVFYNGTVGSKASFDELLVAAKSGGFSSISLFPETYLKAKRQYSDQDIQQKLTQHQLEVFAIEPVLNWVDGHDFPFSRWIPKLAPKLETILEIANATHAKSLNVTWARRKKIAPHLIIEALTQLSDQAAELNLQLHLEFLPWSQISNLTQAIEVIQQVNRSNCGIMFDCWHHYRSGLSNHAIKELPCELVTGLQICDHDKKYGLIPELEAISNRKLPDEGTMNIREILTNLKLGGCQANYGIEVFSNSLYKNSPEDIGMLSRQALDKVTSHLS